MNLLRSYEKRSLAFRTWLFDRSSLSLSEEFLARRTQCDPGDSLENDRLREVSEYFGITRQEALEAHNDEAREHCREAFSDVSTDARVLQNYRDVQKFKIARMMLAFTRFKQAYQLIRYANGIYPPARRGKIRVLDYGCGTSDYGLGFAVYGYAVTIADVAGGHLDFARWRFERRGLPVLSVPITEEQLYPELPPQDFIVCAEVFEHLREPIRVLRNMHAALPRGGLLWYSGYPDYEREVGGEHLQEAADCRDEALAFVQSHFKPATTLQLPGCLYRKR